MAKAATRITQPETKFQPRLPSPPRTPSFGAGSHGAMSGTRPISPTTSDGEFPKEEPSSFDTRRTPVVPAQWPANDEEMKPTGRPPSEPETPVAKTSEGPEVTVTEQDADASAPPPEPTLAGSISVVPLASGEPDFFNTHPHYSIEPPVHVSEPPRARPSPLRSILSKLLFAMIVSAVVMLLSYEASIALDQPSLNPAKLLAWHPRA